MSQEKLPHDYKTWYESLSNLNLLSLWSHDGSNSSSITKEEYLVNTNQPIEEEQSNFINQTISWGVLATLVLLSAATWLRATEISQAVQEVGKNSVEQLILSANDRL